jgi:hypothetical protein
MKVRECEAQVYEWSDERVTAKVTVFKIGYRASHAS